MTAYTLSVRRWSVLALWMLVVGLGGTGVLGNAAPVYASPAQSSHDETSSAPTLEQLVREVERLRAELERLRRQLDPERIAELENQIAVLTEEIQRLREAQAPPVEYRSAYGLGPSASRVYQQTQGVSIAGYGEIDYRNVSDGDKIADAHRLILYLGYRFSDRILFNSEIEFEHGTTDENLDERHGEISVEFAYLDFLIDSRFNVRAGLMLVPLGFINEIHEPPTFYGVNRPAVERVLIPTTWREIGLGVFGELGPHVQYRAYLINGLDARGISADGIRSARGSGNRARFQTAAWVARLDWLPSPNLQIGVGTYLGRADQGFRFDDGRSLRVSVRLIEAHAQFEWHGLEARALYVYTRIPNAAELNRWKGLEGTRSVGSTLAGGYIEAAFNVATLLHTRPEWTLAPFVRWETYDTHRSVPEGYLRDPARDWRVWTLGVVLKPMSQVVIKADVQFKRNRADNRYTQWNLGVGFNF